MIVQNNRVLMLASVASMIDLFNMNNIKILKSFGCKIDVVANFRQGSITSQKRVDEFMRELKDKDIDVIDVSIPRSVFQVSDIIRSYKTVKTLADERHYRIVHCHSPIGGVIARLACRNARKKGTKVIYTGHGLHFFKGAPIVNWLIFYPIERFCSLFTDVMIAINHEDYLREKSWNTCRVEYVPGIGVDTASFMNMKIEKESLRKDLGFSYDDFIFMSTGQISVRKNHEVIIRALAKINDERVKYLIVGFGELEEKLKQMVFELGLENRVVFAGYRSDVKQLLHVVDAFAFPSLQEGLPVALMEAMAAGLPVVCSRIRGNVDLIENGKGGYLCDAHDIADFAEKMENIVRNDVSQMKEINQKTIKNFDRKVVNEDMVNIYKAQMGEAVRELNMT